MASSLLTHSRLSTFRACPRRHWFRYEIGLRPEQQSRALRVGTAFHAAMEAQDLGHDVAAAIDAIVDLDPYDKAMVAAMVVVHGERWSHEVYEVVATEVEFDLPLTNPDTGQPSRLWRLAGKIDRIYRLQSGALVLGDYKTTSEDISSDSDLWLRLSLDQQMSIYVIAARALGYDVNAILYDVVVRPRHRPNLATTPDKVRRKKDGTPYANVRTADETPEEFAARVADAMRAEPDRYFARHEIARLDQDLDETRAEVWQQQQTIREMQRSGLWYRNPGACVTPWPCDYLSICQTCTQPPAEVPAGFVQLADVHPELSATEQGPSCSATASGPSDATH